jgi:hypothetical protein
MTLGLALHSHATPPAPYQSPDSSNRSQGARIPNGSEGASRANRPRRRGKRASIVPRPHWFDPSCQAG